MSEKQVCIKSIGQIKILMMTLDVTLRDQQSYYNSS